MNMETWKPKTESWRRRTTECLSHKEPAKKPHKGNHVIRPACLLHEWADLPILFFSPSLKSCSWKWNTSSVILGGGQYYNRFVPLRIVHRSQWCAAAGTALPRFSCQTVIPSRRVSRSRFMHGKWKWLLTARNPDEKKKKKPTRRFQVAPLPREKGLTSLHSAGRLWATWSDRPLLCLVYGLPLC